MESLANPPSSSLLGRQSQIELESLTHLIESMWTNHKPPVSPHSLDLDEMFNFLREEKAELMAAEPEKAEALDAINQQFEQLDKLWTETEKVRALSCLPLVDVSVFVVTVLHLTPCWCVSVCGDCSSPHSLLVCQCLW